MWFVPSFSYFATLIHLSLLSASVLKVVVLYKLWCVFGVCLFVCVGGYRVRMCVYIHTCASTHSHTHTAIYLHEIERSQIKTMVLVQNYFSLWRYRKENSRITLQLPGPTPSNCVLSKPEEFLHKNMVSYGFRNKSVITWVRGQKSWKSDFYNCSFLWFECEANGSCW